MNMGEYGGRLQRIGLANLQALADLENKRNWAQYEMDTLNSKAKGEAVGSLAGAGVGLLRGAYDIYQKGKPMETPPGGAQATERAAKAAVAPEAVLGKDTPLAKRDTRTLAQKVDDQYPVGIGGAAIKEQLYRPAMLDEDTSWVDGFISGARNFPSHILDRGGY